MNTERFLAEPNRYFAGSYKEFVSFGGPCVYFHDASRFALGRGAWEALMLSAPARR